MKSARISVDVMCPGCGEKLHAVGHEGARLRLSKHLDHCPKARAVMAKKGPRS